MSNLKRSDRAAITYSILSPYLTAKKDRSILGAYERIAPGPDGKVRTVLSPVVTETGRLASSESFIDPHSTNLQNLPKKEAYKDPLYRVRDSFIAPPGYLLLARDLDKAEAVVVGFESHNWDFYEKIVSGDDVHRWVAAQAYHSGNEKAVRKEERQRCKNVLYASLYMAGIPKITSTINADVTSRADRLTQADVQAVYDVIMDILALDAWWDRVWDELMDPEIHGGYRWLENPLGFRRCFYNTSRHNLHKEAVNFFPQSTVASVIDRALIRAWEEIDSPGTCEFILQVHDELLFLVTEDKVEHYARLTKEIMEEPFEAHGREVFIPSSCEVGRRWEAFRGSDSEPLDPDNTLERLEPYHV